MDISIITETKNKRQETLKIPRFQTILCNTLRNYVNEAGGLAIVIKQDLQWELINGMKSPSKDVELLGIKIKDPIMTINLIAIYRRPRRTEKQGVWKK